MLPSKNIHDTLVNLIKEKRFDYELRNYLKNQGISEEEYEPHIAEARKSYEKVASKKTRIIWGVLTTCALVLFLLLIPVELSNHAPMAIAAVGSLVISTCLLQAVTGFQNLQEYIAPKEKDWRHMMIAAVLIPALVVFVMLAMVYDSNVDSELEKYGMPAQGIVTEQYTTTIRGKRKMVTYNVKVKFTAENGFTYHLSTEIGKDKYRSFYVGKTVPLTYSKNDPRVFRLN
jgi:hypothetical protein